MCQSIQSLHLVQFEIRLRSQHLRHITPLPSIICSSIRRWPEARGCKSGGDAQSCFARGRYTDAYMVNRESNVFPAILGRTCDRPCEPACRRTRVDGNPVAICRLKRVAADLKGEITGFLPEIPTVKNGRRIACVGAGPASLTIAN